MIKIRIEMIARHHSAARSRCLMLLVCLTAIVFIAGCWESDTQPAQQTGQLPVIRGTVSNATADKPQSKLWYAHGRWWAWLPTPTGSRIWSRDDIGWNADETLEKQLQGLAGRADVWADDDVVRAVLVASQRLSIVTLRWDDGKQAYRLQGEPTVWPLEVRSSVETATIARDATGSWWIAYDQDRVMWVRRSTNEQASEWSEPIAVSKAAASNDFCTIIALPDAVGIFWSDHVAESFLFRRHNNNSAPDEWEEIEVVMKGSGAVDDHLNAAVANDGTLYVVTRTGGGAAGLSHLQLYTRRPDGEWAKNDYGNDTNTVEHSRPIVFLAEGSRKLCLCHSVYIRRADGTRTSQIACLNLDAGTFDFSQQATVTIKAALPVNSVTGPKAPLPAGVRPLILASDTKGNIYEGRP